MKSIGLFVMLLWVGFLMVGSYYASESMRCNNKEVVNVY